MQSEPISRSVADVKIERYPEFWGQIRPDLWRAPILICESSRFLGFPQQLGHSALNMKDHVYKLIELTGTSTTSIEDAVNNAIKRAHKTVKNLCWFQMVETRGNIDKGKVHHWQVTIKVGFSVAD